MRPISFIVLIVLSFGKFTALSANDSTGVSNASVIRLQLQSIADEVVGQAKLDSIDRVSVFVEGEAWRSLVENAFIEALQKRNYISVLDTGMITSGRPFRFFFLVSILK